MRVQPLRGLVVAAFFAMGVGGGVALAAYEGDAAAEEEGGSEAKEHSLARAVEISQYLDGDVRVTTLEMMGNVALALHEDHARMFAMVEKLRDEVARLTEEVRRISAGRRS